ncbi:MAG: ATP-dependent DNA helicase [Sulfuricurvum sp. PC08-66]|nr:MAG: ATP-dependent DNA helicase [Sulfuricurvum sp. PC08-66]
MPLTRLNSEQYAAATAPRGANLIIASAGTGKTSTIVGRIAHLIGQGVAPHEILLLTFTNKAAAEMVARVAVYFSQEIATQIDAGTFHAVSYRWLKKIDQRIVLKQPAELKTLFRSVHERRRFDHINADVSAYGANFLYDKYSLFQNTNIDSTFEQWISANEELHAPYAAIYADICVEFERLKNSYGFVNFNDLLIMMRDRMHEMPIAYQEVLIDEYQDTNTLQGSLIERMQPPSLFCVGDYDQSIYAFNGANINIIANFAQNFSNAKVFNLSKNYRSTVPILDLANRVIQNNARIYPKSLEVTRTDVSIAPKLLVYEELFEQYKGISHKISNSTTPHDEIAVIFRNNASADGIEATLRELGIACKRRGGTGFFDAKEVKAILDIYVMMINRHDLMAFIHLFEYAKGIGSAIATELFEALRKLGDGDIFQGLYKPDPAIRDPFLRQTHNYQLGLFDDVFELGSVIRFKSHGFEEAFLQNPILKHPKLGDEGVLFLYQFYKLAQRLRTITKPLSMIQKIVDSELYRVIIEQLAHQRATQKDGSINQDKKLEAIERIKVKAALLQELSKPYNDHERFINAMVLGSQDLTKGEGINLLSVHASKGLEFREVYIIDLMDGRFPNRKLMNKGGSLDEERRLFYVAVTRAKDILYLSYARYDQVRKTDFVASQFLYEAKMLPEDEEFRKMKAMEALKT